MKASELRGQDASSLRSQLAELERQLFDLKYQWQSEESPDTSQKAKIRRDIARIKTVLRERETVDAAAKAAPQAASKKA